MKNQKQTVILGNPNKKLFFYAGKFISFTYAFNDKEKTGQPTGAMVKFGNSNAAYKVNIGFRQWATISQVELNKDKKYKFGIRILTDKQTSTIKRMDLMSVDVMSDDTDLKEVALIGSWMRIGEVMQSSEDGLYSVQLIFQPDDQFRGLEYYWARWTQGELDASLIEKDVRFVTFVPKTSSIQFERVETQTYLAKQTYAKVNVPVKSDSGVEAIDKDGNPITTERTYYDWVPTLEIQSMKTRDEIDREKIQADEN